MIPLIIIIFFIICANFTAEINGEFGRHIDSDDELSKFVNNNVDDYWQNMIALLQNYSNENSQKIFENFDNVIERDNLRDEINPKCLNILTYMIQHPMKHEWIIKMIDSGILNRPTGLLSGTTTELGDFDQCLSIENEFQNEKFVGKYCLATVHIPRVEKYKYPTLVDHNNNNQSTVDPSWTIKYIQEWYNNDNYYSIASAICFPSLCNENEIKQLLLSYYDFLQLTQFNVTYCQSNEQPRQYSFGEKIAWTIVLSLCLFILIATMIETFFGDQNNSIIYKIILCFSLIKNNRFLFQIKPIKSSSSSSQRQEFRFIHGIRAIAAMFIMFSHAGGLIMVPKLMPVSAIARYPNDAITISKTLTAQPFYNGALVVMTFFVISGFLSTYLGASAEKLKIHFIPYVILRWLRLTPPLIGLICFNICLEAFGSGPLFHHDILWPTLRPCYENWWKHVLYFSNYLPVDEMCNISTWYLAADLQIHIVGFVLLVIYTSSQYLAMIMCWIFVVIGMISIVIPIMVEWTKHHLIQVLIYTKFRFPHEAAQFVFFACFMQFIPYFLGCAIGFVVLENRLIKFRKWQEITIWILSTMFLLTIPFSSYAFAADEMKINGDPTMINAIIFSTMILIWSLSNVWVVYQCAIKPKMLLSSILSANLFKPLSRLSFSLYLSHLMTIWFMTFQVRHPISILNWIDIFKICSYTLCSGLILGYVLHLTFEAPIIGLLMLFFKNKNNNNTFRSNRSIDHRNVQQQQHHQQQQQSQKSLRSSNEIIDVSIINNNKHDINNNEVDDIKSDIHQFHSI